MAKEGYTSPWYFYWSTLDGGGKYISNGSWNFEMKKYTNYIDEVPRKVWDHPRIYDGKYWKYNFVNDGKYDEINDLFYDDYNGYYLYDEQEPFGGIFPTVSGSGAKLTGTGKADSIRNDGDKANINAGAGNDYIWNEAGVNVVFQYNTGDGNDTVSGFNDTSKLSIAGGTYTSTKSGDNIIVTVGKGKISLMGAASLSAVTIDGVKKTSKTLTVTNKSESPVTAKASIQVIDASTRTTAVKIAGNDAANIIFGGKKNDSIRGGKGADKIYGGSGNDTLWGDAGNDSLYGGAGNDTFIYKPGEGTDKIFDYASGDMLKILNADGSNGSFKSSKYSGGDLTLSINGGGKVIFSGVAKGDTFNINGTTYQISGFKLKSVAPMYCALLTLPPALRYSRVPGTKWQTARLANL